MMLRRSSENAILATVSKLRRLLRKADFVTKRERVITGHEPILHSAASRSVAGLLPGNDRLGQVSDGLVCRGVIGLGDFVEDGLGVIVEWFQSKKGQPNHPAFILQYINHKLQGCCALFGL